MQLAESASSSPFEMQMSARRWGGRGAQAWSNSWRTYQRACTWPRTATTFSGTGVGTGTQTPEWPLVTQAWDQVHTPREVNVPEMPSYSDSVSERDDNASSHSTSTSTVN